jgi:hypothetical protein
MMKIERAVDRYNREILSQTSSYTVSGFTPRGGWIREPEVESLVAAKELAVRLLTDHPRMRTVLLYAADQHERHVMVGSYDRQLRYKPVDN